MLDFIGWFEDVPVPQFLVYLFWVLGLGLIALVALAPHLTGKSDSDHKSGSDHKRRRHRLHGL